MDLKRIGGEIVFCNPPYSKRTRNQPGQEAWIKKCYEEGQKTTVVMLIPSRTDTKAFHKYIYGKAEIRFVKGRLKFGGSTQSAPFPSMIVVFRPNNENQFEKKGEGMGTIKIINNSTFTEAAVCLRVGMYIAKIYDEALNDKDGKQVIKIKKNSTGVYIITDI